MESCAERREILQTKLDLTEQRLQEALNTNMVYKDMVLSIRKQNQHQEQMNQKLAEKEDDLSKVVAELEAINQLENQRRYQMNSVHYECRNKIKHDQELMGKIAVDKQEHQKQEEEETQHVLYQIL